MRAWRKYHDTLNQQMLPSNACMINTQIYVDRRDGFVSLLKNMAEYFKYNFDDTYIKNADYAPSLHSEIDSENAQIRKEYLQLLQNLNKEPNIFILQHIENMIMRLKSDIEKKAA